MKTRQNSATHSGPSPTQPAKAKPQALPIDVQCQAVGLPAHRGRVGLQEEATQKLDQGLLVRKFVQLVHQSCAQLVLLAAWALTCRMRAGLRAGDRKKWSRALKWSERRCCQCLKVFTKMVIKQLWIHWRRDRLPTPVFLGFPGGSAGNESPCSAGDPGSISGLGRSPGEGKGYSLQYPGWRSPWTIQSMGLQRVGHNWATFTFQLFTGSGRSPGEGNGNPLQYSCLENPTDRGAWRATVHGVEESDMT